MATLFPRVIVSFVLLQPLREESMSRRSLRPRSFFEVIILAFVHSSPPLPPRSPPLEVDLWTGKGRGKMSKTKTTKSKFQDPHAYQKSRMRPVSTKRGR